MDLFKVGDKLEFINDGTLDEDIFKGVSHVEITSINHKDKVYYWKADTNYGQFYSGYYFHEAKLINKK